MDGVSICQLIEAEKVTFTGGVPTIWLGVMNELQQNPGKYDLSSLKSMVCGGSAPPRAMIDWFETNLGVNFIHAWGMTETSPLGSITRLKPKMERLAARETARRQTARGHIRAGIEDADR